MPRSRITAILHPPRQGARAGCAPGWIVKLRPLPTEARAPDSSPLAAPGCTGRVRSASSTMPGPTRCSRVSGAALASPAARRPPAIPPEKLPRADLATSASSKSYSMSSGGSSWRAPQRLARLRGRSRLRGVGSSCRPGHRANAGVRQEMLVGAGPARGLRVEWVEKRLNLSSGVHPRTPPDRHH